MNTKTSNWIANVAHHSKKVFAKKIYCRKCDSMTFNNIAYNKHYYEESSELKVLYTQKCFCCKNQTVEIATGNNWSALFHNTFFD